MVRRRNGLDHDLRIDIHGVRRATRREHVRSRPETARMARCCVEDARSQGETREETEERYQSGRKAPKELSDRFGNVLLFLLWFRLGIERLRRNTSPYELFLGGIVHAHVELPDVHRGCRSVGRGRGHSAAVPSSTPATTIAPTCVIRSELLFLTDGGLITDVKICSIRLRFGQPFRGEFSVNSRCYLLGRQAIRLVGSLDRHPFVSLVFRKVFVLIEIVANILSYCSTDSQESECDC